MATPDVLRRDDAVFNPHPENAKLRGMSVEKKIEFLENLAGKVSNRRTRRWLNDRLLMELVPRLNADEIRGLFAPPPFGDEVPRSTFSMTNVEEWDKFRNIDMDREANIIGAIKGSHAKAKGRVDPEKMSVLNAWRRIDCRTREALRRSCLFELIEGFEAYIRSYITAGVEEDILVLQVQDPFQRLLLHGVCEYYNLASETGGESSKTTKISKKKKGSPEIPGTTLAHYLRMSKEGVW